MSLPLYPELNARLRPKLLADLKPGSRIVSNQFGIGDWKPLAMKQVTPSDREQWITGDRDHLFHMWVVPPR